MLTHTNAVSSSFFSENTRWNHPTHPKDLPPVASRTREKTLAELKAMVNPKDETIQRVKQQLSKETNQSKESGLKSRWRYLQKALEYIQSLETLSLDSENVCWRSPTQVFQEGAGDAFDKAIFLCALLIAGGHPNAKIRVLALGQGVQRPVVLISFNDKQVLADPVSETPSFILAKSIEEALCAYSSRGKKVVKSLYEFNNQDFEFFEEK